MLFRFYPSQNSPLAAIAVTGMIMVMIMAAGHGQDVPTLEPELPLVPLEKVEVKPAAPALEIEMPKVRAEQLEKELTTGRPASTATELQEELEELRVQQAVMGRELENSKTELGTLRDENDRLKLQMQALGLSALSGDQRSLQLRLLDAVNDYRLADQARQLLTEQLVKLSDAVTAYQNTSDASSRRLLDEALDQSAAVLKGTAPAEVAEPTPLEQARVVSFKRDLGLAVINCGKASGLRLGMPLSIIRKDKTIAQGVIVDCRDLITGVLITSSVAAKDGVTLGDTIKLETTQKTK